MMAENDQINNDYLVKSYTTTAAVNWVLHGMVRPHFSFTHRMRSGRLFILDVQTSQHTYELLVAADLRVNACMHHHHLSLEPPHNNG